MITRLFGSEFNRVIELLKPRHWSYFAGMLMMVSLRAILTISEAFTIKTVTNAIISKNVSSLGTGLLVYIFIVVVVLFLFPISNWIYNKDAKLTIANVRKIFYSKLIQLPLVYFDHKHPGEVISLMNNDISAVEAIYGSNIRRLLAPAITAGIIMLVMLLMNLKIALLLILMNLIYVAIDNYYSDPIRRISEKLLADLSTLTEHALDLITGFITVKIFHIENILLKKYTVKNLEIRENFIKRKQIEGSLERVNFILSMTSSIGGIMLGFLIAIRTGVDVGSLLALISIQSRLNQSMLQFSKCLPIMQEALAGARRVFDFLDLPSQDMTINLANKVINLHNIEFKNVCFGYGESELVLKNLNLSIQVGDIIAITGPSGSGKSTILKLLLGFYQPSLGEILINGEPMDEIPLKAIRDTMAYVPQEPYLFNGTIEENIRLGNLNATSQEIKIAAKAAYADEFIENLPDKYLSYVGERGSALSGGQKQRIAIARAVLKDSPLLLLDEATSALDYRSESLVQKALNRLIKGRTAIMVAHQLSTIRYATKIYAFKDGKLIEQDKVKFDELIN